LLGADGGVQKIKSVIRAILRHERDYIDVDKYNENTSPNEILKFIASQVTSFQELDEKPEHVTKIIKRLKRMVRLPEFPSSSNNIMFESESRFFGSYRRRMMPFALAAQENSRMKMNV
jgi:hypothetical protein